MNACAKTPRSAKTPRRERERQNRPRKDRVVPSSRISLASWRLYWCAMFARHAQVPDAFIRVGDVHVRASTLPLGRRRARGFGRYRGAVAPAGGARADEGAVRAGTLAAGTGGGSGDMAPAG